MASDSSAAQSIAEAAKRAFEVSQLIPSSERIKALQEIRKELEAAAGQDVENGGLRVRLPEHSNKHAKRV